MLKYMYNRKVGNTYAQNSKCMSFTDGSLVVKIKKQYNSYMTDTYIE